MTALPAIVGYTMRACLPVKRRLGLLAPCLGALLFGLLARTTNENGRVVYALLTPPRAVGFARVADVGLFTLVVPIACLVVGDAVLGSEVRSGTFPFTWLSPVAFRWIVLGRWLGGVVLSVATVVPACMLAAVVAGAPESAAAAGIASAAGCVAYIGLFIMIGCITQRAAVWSLAIVFLVERLIGTTLAGVAQLSPTWESRAVFAKLAPGAHRLLRDGIPQGWSAVLRLGLITAATLAVASWRMGRLRLSGASD